jgi:glucokinase
MSEEKQTVAMDLGGTKIVAALLDGIKIIDRHKQKTNAQEGEEAVLENIIDTVKTLLKKNDISTDDIQGIGIAIPGQLDPKRGIIINTPNIGFSNFPIVERLQEVFHTPVLIENDVRAGTYGEYLAGAAQGYSYVLGVFPGTGIGGGIIIDGKLYHGATGNAGEVGHMIIQTDGPLCNCGQYGCLEAVASRTSMTKDAVALAGAGKAPATFEKAGTDIKNYKSSVYKKAYKKNDEGVIRVVERAAAFLGIGIANCVNILNPEIVVIGGGLIEKLGETYLQIVEQSMRDHALPSLVDNVKLVASQLEDDAAIIGAAGLLDRNSN